MRNNLLIILCVVVLIFAAVQVPDAGAQTVLTIEPTDTLDVANCFPFGSGGPTILGTWPPYMGFIYQNIPAFELNPGDTIAFDLGAMNDANIQLEIAMAPTTVNGGVENAGAFTTIVSNTQTPLNPMGDTIIGNYELQFTVENAFSFPGGGLIIRFSNPSAAYALDTTCSEDLVRADSSDASGNFVGRFFFDPDGVYPWIIVTTNSIGGFRLIFTSATSVPAMNEWGFIIFMVIAGAASVVYVRKRKTA